MVLAGGWWELTPQALESLLGRLSADRAAAATAYEALRRRLVDFFDFRGCPNPDAYADQTLDRVARKLGEGETVDHIYGYVHAVAKLILLEAGRERQKERSALLEWHTRGGAEPGSARTTGEIDHERRLNACNVAWPSWPGTHERWSSSTTAETSACTCRAASGWPTARASAMTR